MVIKGMRLSANGMDRIANLDRLKLDPCIASFAVQLVLNVNAWGSSKEIKRGAYTENFCSGDLSLEVSCHQNRFRAWS